MDSKTSKFCFFQLPLEIRLNIYEWLFTPPETAHEMLTFLNGVTPNSNPVHQVSSAKFSHKSMPTLEVRPLKPEVFVAQKKRRSFERTAFYTLADRFRRGTVLTTYHMPTKHKPDTAILRVNQQIYHEAVGVLYSNYMFAFDVYVETVAPFTMDLTIGARKCIKCVAITKEASPYEKESDSAEWINACASIANLPGLEELQLRVIATKPSREGWHGVEPIGRHEMEEMIKVQSFEWIRHLVRIKHLKRFDIKAQVEICMSPVSDALYNWVRLSKSIEGSFKAVVWDMMVGSGSVDEDDTSVRKISSVSTV